MVVTDQVKTISNNISQSDSAFWHEFGGNISVSIACKLTHAKTYHDHDNQLNQLRQCDVRLANVLM